MAQIIHLNGSGVNGQYGLDGANGRDGRPGWFSFSINGVDGGHGQDATLPTPGGDGKDMNISLATTTTKKAPDTTNDEQQRQQHEEEYDYYNSKSNSRLAVEVTTKFFGEETLASTAVLPLEELGGICWEARGGMGGYGGSGGHGGNGSDGQRGADATEHSKGGNGGRGGNGGNGGRGTSGANGGRGGNVEFVVSEQDTYLLMAAACANDHQQALKLVGGGPGGSPGQHGVGGRGGFGGPGGHSHTYEVRRGGYDHTQGKDVVIVETKKMKGGHAGPNGRNGFTPTEPLYPGLPGANGLFVISCIDVDGSVQSYSARYDLSLVGFEVMNDRFEGDPTIVEFGDTVTLHNIALQNVGPMPTPRSQRVMVQLIDSGEPFIRPCNEYSAFLPRGHPLVQGEVGYTEGELQFFVPIPDAGVMGEDFDRMVRKGGVCLKAIQLGPEIAGAESKNAVFQFPYDNFPSSIFTATFPIENSHGLIGLTSIGVGEATMIHFDVKNIGSRLLGGESRSLKVQFYLQPLTQNSILPRSICYQLEDGEKVELSDSSENNVVVNIPLLEPGQGTMVSHKLRFLEDVEPYHRLALTAEIILQDLPCKWNTEESRSSVVQRRTLDVVCEPCYARRNNSNAILISSTSTNGQVYRELLGVLQNKFGIIAEVYPVSRYGSLEADFRVPPSNITLAEIFRGKLVIMMNQTFMLSGRESVAVRPSELLPSGCLPESSGFHPSTRWVFLDADDACLNKLLNVHSSSLPTRVDCLHKEHENIDMFYKSIEELIREEKTVIPNNNGTHIFRCETIRVHARGMGGMDEKAIQRRIAKLGKRAQAIRNRLSKRDPLHQYTVDYKPFSPEEASKQKTDNYIGSINVRRGAFRPLNSTILVRDFHGSESFDNPVSVSSKAILLAVALGLPPDLRVAAFCRAIEISRSETNNHVLDVLKDAFVSEFLRDVANIMDGRRGMRSEELRMQAKQLLPTIFTLKESKPLTDLLQRANDDGELRKKCGKELSQLIALMECVSYSKDLTPKWLPFSFKHKVRPLLIDQVRALENALQPHVDLKMKNKAREDLECAVRDYIRKERRKFRVSTHQRWRKGLNYLHSTNNRATYGDSPLQVCRLLEHSSDASDQEQLSMRVCLPQKTVLAPTEVTKIRRMYHLAADNAAKSKRHIIANRKTLLVTYDSI